MAIKKYIAYRRDSVQVEAFVNTVTHLLVP
jgi:hypothetical protein